MAIILGIESTCDETAAAVVVDGFDVRSNVVASQVELHAKYQGVVPEIASRAHLENILPVVREALAGAGLTLAQLDAVAVAHRPGLIGSLLIGVTAAKTLAWALGKPLIGVDHVHAHLYSVMLETGALPPMPAVGLVCSGGHTALYHVRDFTDVTLIGSTLDDAVGEAYDKVASILHLGYPGGPAIDRLAGEVEGRRAKARAAATEPPPGAGAAPPGPASPSPAPPGPVPSHEAPPAELPPAGTSPPEARDAAVPRLRFPRTMLDRDSLDFSFSGLKTAVLYHVRGHQGRQRAAEALSEAEIAETAAAFQEAAVDVIVRKLRRAVARIGARGAILGGGVSANRGLRQALAAFEVPVAFPPPRYCTDNAAMSAGLAELFHRQGQFSPLALDAITWSQFRK